MSVRTTDDRSGSALSPVVVGVDGTEGALPAVRWAAATAARGGRELLITHGLDLSAVHAALGNYATTAPALIAELRSRGAEFVADARRIALAAAPSIVVRTEVSDAKPAELLIRYSAGAHPIVLGVTPGIGTLLHLGSTLLAVVSHGHGDIVVVRGAIERDGPVVVGVDGSAVGEVALAAAFREASERRAELVAVHIWSDVDLAEFSGYSFLDVPPEAMADAEKSLLTTRLTDWCAKYPEVRVTCEVYPFDAARRLTEWSESAGLLVVGSRGRGGFRGMLLGSTSNSLVQQAFCPVMVVHPD
ncbi:MULTISPECIES: universal stress protein [unclassified Nocardia]|uniref:universal stress protein n=1 Tax=unclassified Nocardia TaxID=2637762 RepID=UPI001CE493CD|nr:MULTISPECIES: universal stress protein [unclassified Nocardia]